MGARLRVALGVSEEAAREGERVRVRVRVRVWMWAPSSAARTLSAASRRAFAASRLFFAFALRSRGAHPST